MKLSMSDDSLTTDDIKAVMQHENDIAKNNKATVSEFVICTNDLPDGYEYHVSADDLEFYAGKFLVIQGDSECTYIPVGRVTAIRVEYD